jgi:hypothetical protein
MEKLAFSGVDGGMRGRNPVKYYQYIFVAASKQRHAPVDTNEYSDCDLPNADDEDGEES